MTSKAERRRRKVASALADAYALPPIAARQPSGRRASEPADRMALDARARQLGLTLTVTEARREARAPWWGCLAGRLMADACRDEGARQAYWRAICHIRRVQAAYDAALGAPRRHAACLSILTPVAALSADAASPETDLRSDLERFTDAERAWEQMQVWLLSAPASSRAAALALVLDDRGCGKAFVLSRPALDCVADGLDCRSGTSAVRFAAG